MGLIPDEIIAQVLERTDIVQTIAAYIPLKRTGQNFKANCPFHNEKTPSFTVNAQKQIYHCFGCGVGGNAIGFVMQQERLEFPEAVRLLAQKVGITVAETNSQTSVEGQFKQAIFAANTLSAEFFHNNLVTDKSEPARVAREYLKNRGVNLEVVKKFKIGFALDQWDALLGHLKKKDISLKVMEKAGLIIPRENKEGHYDRFRNRITFPIFDVKGQCLAFGARAMGDAPAKYINSPETSVYTKGQHLYGLQLAKDAVLRQDGLIVVEGYMDFITPFQAGVENIVASCGTALTVEQIRLIRRFTHNVVMLFDADLAGESAMVRSLDLLIEEGMNVKVATLPKGEDPDSFVRKSGAAAFQEKILQAQSFFDFKLRNLMAKHDYKSVDGRAKISMEMLPTINKFENSVKKFGYAKQLADCLMVSEQALLIELEKLPQARSEKTPAPKPAPNANARKVEYDLLKLIVENTEFIRTLRSELRLTDFQDPHIKVLMTKIFELDEKGGEISFQLLLQSLSDPKSVTKMSSLMASEEEIGGDKDRMLQDYIFRLKTERINLQKKDLNRQLYEAQMQGDQIRLKEIIEQYNQLIKR